MSDEDYVGKVNGVATTRNGEEGIMTLTTMKRLPHMMMEIGITW
jgi:hypothetical protein